GRNDAQPKPSLEDVAASPCGAFKILHLGQNALDAGAKVQAFRGKAHGTAASLEQTDAKLLFHLSNLRRQRGLRDTGSLRRTAEMHRLGKMLEIRKLFQG